MIKKREKVRRLVVAISTLLFPATMLYLSPGIVFKGARTGVISGSYITFGILFLSSLFLGRLFCGWICPGGGLSEIAYIINRKEFKNKKLNILKYVIWTLWIISIILVAILIGGGFRDVDPLLGTRNGFSIHSMPLVLCYYLVIGIILLSSLIIGRRGFCHTLCWMAPFMVLGRKLSVKLNLKRVELTSKEDLCNSCSRCSNKCPMGLPLVEMVKDNNMEHSECILCGVCVDECPTKAIEYKSRSRLT